MSKRIIDIVGKNHRAKWDKTRVACRAIICRDDQILMAYEILTDLWMLPGGGLEGNESLEDCCRREVAEETGFLIRPVPCAFEIHEYYEEYRYISYYYTAEIIGTTERRLTDRERSVGMAPRWIPITKALQVFSLHEYYAATDEQKRGMYLREYTALTECIAEKKRHSDLIAAAKAYIADAFQNNVDGHDYNHSIRVYQNALQISDACPDCDLTVVSLAALLHDVDDHKLFQTENNRNARAFLEEHSVEPDVIDQICGIINGVSFSHNKGKRPDSLEGQIVQDADRLDAMGAIGVARTFAYGGSHGRSLEESVQHFYDKLLLLKDELNTDAAKAIARTRHTFLEDFLREWRRETDSSM
ncbi:MAG: NUDIX domain-containing protein [Firmicutes bacterium]|nr:NUDIX domain-containing protein [Bacillota bacterium]